MTIAVAPTSWQSPPSLRAMCQDGQVMRGDISNEMYHADRSCVSASGLKLILRTPAHFKAYMDGARRETPSLSLGAAIHTRLLEPQVFAKEYAVAPVSDRRLAEFREFQLANANRKVLTPDEMVVLEGIEHSVHQHHTLHELLWSGVKEHTIVWQDKETGIWCKIRPDLLCAQVDIGSALDFKSTEDASREAFLYSCIRYKYHLQSAFYTDGISQFLQRDIDFLLAPIEKTPPFGVACYGAPAEMLEEGRLLYRRALRLLKECLDTNQWPGYQPEGDYELLPWPRRGG